jgi:hypothetical protein
VTQHSFISNAYFSLHNDSPHLFHCTLVKNTHSISFKNIWTVQSSWFLIQKLRNFGNGCYFLLQVDMIIRLLMQLLLCTGVEGTRKTMLFLITFLPEILDRDSAVSIATRYWLNGPGIESQWRARFSAHVQTGRRANPTSGSFSGIKRQGRGIDHKPHLMPRLMKE